MPFATAFLGDYPMVPLVVALYGFVLFMAAAAFSLMIRFVFFKSELLPGTMSVQARHMQLKRSLVGVVLYGAAVPLAFVHPGISFLIFLVVPLYYFIPRRVGGV